jgi:hypothetical protein
MAQPDPHEEAAREWLTAKSCEAGHIYSAMPPEGSERAYFDSLFGGGVLASLAALLREREAAAERRGAEGADSALSETESRLETLLARGDFADDDVATTKGWLARVKRARRTIPLPGDK